jgi:hypothetical protein
MLHHVDDLVRWHAYLIPAANTWFKSKDEQQFVTMRSRGALEVEGGKVEGGALDSGRRPGWNREPVLGCKGCPDQKPTFLKSRYI